ncbi:MAG: SOUL family heme-binding protein [Bacilli bacterium]
MYESPDYQLIKKEGNLEWRSYQDFFTVAIHEPSLQGYSGFGYLFNYISGNNRQGVKMKMTVPVINDTDENEKSMEFVIPKIHTQNIPQPLYQQMKIKHYPSQQVLVYSFSGYIPKEKIEIIIEKMKSFAKLQHLVPSGSIKIARYNGPYTLPFLRHNEIWLNVDLTDNPNKVHKA